MNKKIKFEEKILLISAALMAFSIGIWANYRQLWLSNNGFSITSISKILSVALICSGVIAFIISLFSSRIKIKSIILESLIIRIISMIVLLFIKDNFIIKTCVLLTIMCEVIYSISFYPLFSLVDKSNNEYNRKNLNEYISRDLGIILCGLLIGVTFGNYVFNYNTCLLISLCASFISLIFIISHKSKEKINPENNNLKTSLIKIFSYNRNKLFFVEQLLVNISYGIVFDLLLLILTDYIKFNVSFASIFIIVSNLISSIICSILNKKTNITVKESALIKFGTRGLTYIIAFITNNTYVFIFSIFIAYLTSRLLEDRTLIVFVNKNKPETKFLFENIRYFICSIGEGIGAFIAGILLNISLRYLFLGAGIITIAQTILLMICDNIKN